MFKLLFALFLFAAAGVFAQNVDVALPTANQTVTAGNDLIVQVQRPNSLSGSEEVAVVIGLQSCPNRPCTPPSEFLGDVVYNGNFYPEYYEQNLPPYQNFTVVVPSTFPAGTALVGVFHVSLIGAGLAPYMQILNQTITVQV